MRALIVSQHGDVHAMAVASVLARHGHDVLLWAWPELSSDQTASVFVDERFGGWRLGSYMLPFDYFDVIWHRRRRIPKVPGTLHADDVRFASRENAAFWPNLFTCADPRTQWVHRPEVASRGENKLLQLVVARRAGFRVPDSLMSNDGEAIVSYIQDIESGGGRLVYKTFAPAAWKNEESIRIKHTTLVDSQQVLGSPHVAAVPGIYQPRIDKRYEVRITLFGSTCFAVRIDSQARPEWQLDWRAAIDLDGIIAPMDVPPQVLDRCACVLAELGLSTGCFDFIVDDKGDYWFLEVNQQGQFLWIEQSLPALRLLQGMARFLVRLGGGDCRAVDAIDGVTLADIRHDRTYRSLETAASWPILLRGSESVLRSAAAAVGMESAA